MKDRALLVLLAIALVLLAIANVLWGSLNIPVGDVWQILCGGEVEEHPAWSIIILQGRVPQMLTALLTGTALGTCGLLLQTAFRNPLAGPSILGIDSGANLGVAIVLLLLGGTASIGNLALGGHLLVVIAAMLGALAIMARLCWHRAAPHFLRTCLHRTVAGFAACKTTRCFAAWRPLRRESGYQNWQDATNALARHRTAYSHYNGFLRPHFFHRSGGAASCPTDARHSLASHPIACHDAHRSQLDIGLQPAEHPTPRWQYHPHQCHHPPHWSTSHPACYTETGEKLKIRK